MTRDDCLKAYRDFSGQTSDNVRRLCFAGIAIIWVFKAQAGTPGSTDLRIPSILLWSGICILVSLVLDFLQYLYGTIAWGMLHRLKEKAGTPMQTDFKAPAAINWPTNSFFLGKVLFVAVGYALILSFLGQLLLAA
ncbi:MAG: hypothetical protein O2968_04025 [Acidobacteria bacterium]|nr:hypothetical protein [Acidobacteriota bacterium]